MFSNKYLLFILLFMASLFILSGTSFALTTGSISGKIIDDRTGEALPGANVFLKGTTMGAATGADGSFTIENVPPGSYAVVVSFIGYHTEEADVQVVVNEVANVNFSMREDVFRGEEVVVTGIASRTSKAVAEVAVSRVSASNYTVANTYQTTQQLINGKVAGVSIKSSSGNAGSGFRFLVRAGGGLNGNEQPVIYIDGVRLENAEIVGLGVGGQGIGLLADLNPEDIENIEILKGPAAAASYGTNGANGVVLITTKKGRLVPGATKGVSINYKVVRGWNTQSFDYTEDEFFSFEEANSIFRTGSIIQNSISAAGGSNILRYFTSFDSRIEDGITNNNSMNRKNLRANIDVVPNEQLTFRVNASYTYNNISQPQNDNNIFGYLGNTLLGGGGLPLYVWTPREAIDAVFDQAKSNRFIGSLQAEWAPIKGFTGRMTLGIDEHDLRRDRNYPVNQDYGVAQHDAGFRRIYNRKTTLYTYSADVRYTFNPMSDLNVSAVVGTQIFDRRFNSQTQGRFGFLTELITTIDAGAEFDQLEENFSHRRETGIFGEANISYMDQYFLTFGLRRDFASVVGKEAPSINYPKASFAIRMDKYDWFPTFFGLMKARVAYGETGILPELRDGIPLLWEAEAGGFGAGGVVGQIGNETIEPERVKEIEIGLDTEFMNNYAVEFTYYKFNAKNSIIEFRNSPSTGKTASAVPINIGETQGWGIESLVQGSPIRTRNFGLDLTLINNFQDNEVQDLGGAQPIFDGWEVNVIKEGLPKHEFFMIPVNGALFNDDGTYAGPDAPADALENRVSFGNPVPNYTGSFSLNVRLLKNLNLYALADWATGLKVWNFTDLFAARFGNKPRFNELATQLGVAGTGVAGFSSPVEGVAELTPGTPEYKAAAREFALMDWRWDSNYVKDADYLKLREISVSYSLRDLLPKLVGARNVLSDLVIAFSATNVWTTTKYNGPDPEINFIGARNARRGHDFLTLQHPRTYNLSFRFSL
ncbi:MAG: carboxypeptidase-like regulatory domain-containing protein [bacterium]